MSINVDDTMSTIDLQKIYDYLDMLKKELGDAGEVCKKVDDWSYWLPCMINDIKDKLYGNTRSIDEFMSDIATVMTARKNIYDGYCEYLESMGYKITAINPEMIEVIDNG